MEIVFVPAREKQTSVVKSCDSNNIILEKKAHTKNQNIFEYFSTKREAIVYLSKCKHLHLFSEDKNIEDGRKRFIVASYESIYEVSK